VRDIVDDAHGSGFGKSLRDFADSGRFKILDEQEFGLADGRIGKIGVFIAGAGGEGEGEEG
jgi:hypothetical protein